MPNALERIDERLKHAGFSEDERDTILRIINSELTGGWPDE